MNNNTKTMYPINNVSMLVEEMTSSQIITEFNESVGLVAEKIYFLFISRSPVFLCKKSLKLEKKSDLHKKKIIYYCMNVSYSKVLNYLKQLSCEEMEKIGSDFFYLTARKFAKNQSIQVFASFLNLMFKNYGFDGQFIKKFLSNERDYSECLALLEYMRRWDQKEIKGDSQIMLFRTLMVCLNRFCNNPDFFVFLRETKEIFLKTDPSLIQEHLQTLLFNLLNSIFSKNITLEMFEYSLNTFEEIGLNYTDVVCHKIFETINKNTSEEIYFQKMIDFVEKKQLKKNIYIINAILDFYCMNGDFQKAVEIFHHLKQDGITPDNFTYSIMIKGIKKMNNPDLELAERFYQTYVETIDMNNIIIYNSILDVFVTFEKLDKAFEIYTKMRKNQNLVPDHITFNTLIKGCCKVKDFEQANNYFQDMRALDVKPNRITYNSLMDLAVKIQNMQKALYFIQEMQKDGITPDGFTYSIIVNGLKLNDSSPALVSNSLERIKKVIEMNTFRLDEIFFNSILDVCTRYDFVDYLDVFYKLMQKNNIKESALTFGILVKGYAKAKEFDKAFNIFEIMINSNMRINDITYGCILDSCAKNGNMNIALKIYKILKKSEINLNSIVFTTIIKGFIRSEAYEEALGFFNEVKMHQDLSGMIITYNCALDVMVRKKDIVEALKLFEEIDAVFKADLISYSTIIKGLCQNGQLPKALEYVKTMINATKEVDVSVINLFLDSCSNKEDFSLGVKGYQYAMMKNIPPNEITFGIMVKIFGFSRELHKAFDLLDLMEVYEIKPSIIIFTNLIHISFYNRNPKKAELAFTLMRKQGIKGDSLMFSKIIDGLIRFKQSQKVPKYIDYALKDNCFLKKATVEEIKKALPEKEIVAKLELLGKNEHLEKLEGKEERNLKFKNKFKEENPKKFKKIIQEQKLNEEEMKDKYQPKVVSNRQFVVKKKETFFNTEAKDKKEKPLEKPTNNSNNFKQFTTKPKMALFNFRKNKNTE